VRPGLVVDSRRRNAIPAQKKTPKQAKKGGTWGLFVKQGPRFFFFSKQNYKSDLY
jgi:hypothetical protein